MIYASNKKIYKLLVKNIAKTIDKIAGESIISVYLFIKMQKHYIIKEVIKL